MLVKGAPDNNCWNTIKFALLYDHHDIFYLKYAGNCMGFLRFYTPDARLPTFAYQLWMCQHVLVFKLWGAIVVRLPTKFNHRLSQRDMISYVPGFLSLATTLHLACLTPVITLCSACVWEATKWHINHQADTGRLICPENWWSWVY